jgi:hypothetical protein
MAPSVSDALQSVDEGGERVLIVLLIKLSLLIQGGESLESTKHDCHSTVPY